MNAIYTMQYNAAPILLLMYICGFETEKSAATVPATDQSARAAGMNVGQWEGEERGAGGKYWRGGTPLKL